MVLFLSSGLNISYFKKIATNVRKSVEVVLCLKYSQNYLNNKLVSLLQCKLLISEVCIKGELDTSYDNDTYSLNDDVTAINDLVYE